MSEYRVLDAHSCLISQIPSLSDADDGYSRGPWDPTRDRIKDKVKRGILRNQSLLVAVNLSNSLTFCEGECPNAAGRQVG